MKYLTKITLWLLAFITASGLLISCVEDEQAPDFDKMGESTSDIDVKMPAPDSKTFFPGSKVLLKGSGFSASDEVYVQYANYHDDEETDTDEYLPEGSKVKAEVKNFTSTELTFLVPSEITEDRGYGYAVVFFKRGGEEYELGFLYFGPFPVNYDSFGTLMGGDILPLTTTDSYFEFSDKDKVFLQNGVISENGTIQGVGEKIPAEVESVNANELRFIVPLSYVGTAVVILGHDDVEYRLEGLLPVMSPVMVNTPDAVGGMDVELSLRSNFLSFDKADKIYLQPVVENDKGELVDNGDRIAATISMNGDKNLSFIVPVEAVGTYMVIWEHNGVECRTMNYLRVLFPVYSEFEAARIGDIISLRSMAGNLFTSADEVYLRPIDGGNKVKAEIVSIEEWVLLFTVPDLFQGTYGKARVILKHNGVEHELDPLITVYGIY